MFQLAVLKNGNKPKEQIRALINRFEMLYQEAQHRFRHNKLIAAMKEENAKIEDEFKMAEMEHLIQKLENEDKIDNMKGHHLDASPINEALKFSDEEQQNDNVEKQFEDQKNVIHKESDHEKDKEGELNVDVKLKEMFPSEIQNADPHRKMDDHLKKAAEQNVIQNTEVHFS